jgi:asparagine synthase (glutamine-hydrolysing)
MCGICGKLQFEADTKVDLELLERMMGQIFHRGPDGRGNYRSGPVGLAHTRLAIIDLNTGAQPICNEDSTVWIVFNGEIYNYPQLRQELLERGHQFRSASDTEVIIHLYEEYGVESLNRLQGMFTFAIWDEKDQSLFLARDRVGIKPLYYVDTGRALVFGSEIKTLLMDPDVKCEVDPQSVDKFLTHFCLPGRETLWRGIRKLDPGHYLIARKGKYEIKQYWDLRYQPRQWGSFDEAAEQLYELTKRTVREHMISDVPVGFLLSGGVDSTVVLSCAATETDKKISTFTVGFDNAQFEDERVYARLAAKRFNSDHHEITITPQEFWDFLPSLIWHMEEPVCDPPAVSLHYVSKLARSHVKVLLSGEGGDEAFGGYTDYRNFQYLERIKKAIHPFEGALSAAVGLLNGVGPLRKAGKFAPFITTALSEYFYSRVASPFTYFNQNKSELYAPGFKEMVSPCRSLEIVKSLFSRVQDQPYLNQMQYLDTKTTLPDDLLVKADRITMGNSLELRVPFLDHVLLEFAATLPPDYRVKGLATKRILKHAFGKRIPKEIIKRKKAGFPIPIAKWCQEDLRDRVRDVLLDQKALGRGYFTKRGVEQLLAAGDAGRPVAKEIFSLLTLELLHQRFVDPGNFNK